MTIGRNGPLGRLPMRRSERPISMSFKSKWRSRARTVTLCACLPALLIGCGPSIAPAEKPNLAPLPAALAADCADTVDLPQGSLNGAKVGPLWAQDRASLVDCGYRHHAAIQFYRGRDAQLSGEPK